MASNSGFIVVHHTTGIVITLKIFKKIATPSIQFQKPNRKHDEKGEHRYP